MKGLPRRKNKKNLKRKRKCRCKSKRDIISPDIEGRKGHESNNKWEKQKTKPNRKSRDPENDKQKKPFNRELLLERRKARIQRRKEKRLREALFVSKLNFTFD